MKTLILIRHAEATARFNLPDIERPLTHGGIDEAKRQAKKLLSRHVYPELIFSSPAARAQSTALIFSDTLQLEKHQLTIKDRIYDAVAQDLLILSNTITDDFNCVAFVGHNPSISEFCAYLVDDQFISFPTATIALLELNVNSWKELSFSQGKINWIVNP